LLLQFLLNRSLHVTACIPAALEVIGSLESDLKGVPRWEPILRADLLSLARDRLSAAASEIERVDLGTCSALQLCERALVSEYLSMSESPYPWRAQAIECLLAVANRVSRELPSGLFDGLSGVGWTVEHLRRSFAGRTVDNSDINAADDPLEDIDSLLLRRLERDHWPSSYDLIGGLVGVGVFFLERLPVESAYRGITLILTHLERQAEESCSGITWHTPPRLLPENQRRECPAGHYNLGVAHGVPGVLHFLGEAIAAGIEQSRAWHLLEGSVRWLLAQQQPSHALSRYGNWIVPGEEPKVSRLAWCYGDLGIAAIFDHIAQRVAREDWLKFARSLLDVCVTRSPGELTEAELCHGAMGIAHIFNRVYQGNRVIRYKEAANRYYEKGLALMDQLHTETPRRSSGPDPSPFLQGKVGVILALLSAINPIEPQWDRRLMLSGRPRSPYHATV